jgi:hypothetical protein
VAWREKTLKLTPSGKTVAPRGKVVPCWCGGSPTASAGGGKRGRALGHTGRWFTGRTAPADAGERLPSRASDATRRTILLTRAGLERLGGRPRARRRFSGASDGPAGHPLAAPGDSPALVLQGTGRPGLATCTGSHSLLGGRRWRRLLGKRERGDEE